MVAIFVQQMVLITFELIAHCFYQLTNLVITEVSVTKDDGLTDRIKNVYDK